MSAFKFCLLLLEELPAGRYNFIDLLARFTMNYYVMGGKSLERPDKLVYKALAKLMKQGSYRKGVDFRGYERIH